jgi:hypothetical protein
MAIATGFGDESGRVSAPSQPRAVDLETPHRFANEERLAEASKGSSRSCSSAWARPTRRMAVTVTVRTPSNMLPDSSPKIRTRAAVGHGSRRGVHVIISDSVREGSRYGARSAYNCPRGAAPYRFTSNMPAARSSPIALMPRRQGNEPSNSLLTSLWQDHAKVPHPSISRPWFGPTYRGLFFARHASFAGRHCCYKNRKAVLADRSMIHVSPWAPKRN